MRRERRAAAASDGCEDACTIATDGTMWARHRDRRGLATLRRSARISCLWHEKEIHDESVPKPEPHEMRLQTSRGVHTEAAQEANPRCAAAAVRGDIP